MSIDFPNLVAALEKKTNYLFSGFLSDFWELPNDFSITEEYYVPSVNVIGKYLISFDGVKIYKNNKNITNYPVGSITLTHQFGPMGSNYIVEIENDKVL